MKKSLLACAVLTIVFAYFGLSQSPKTTGGKHHVAFQLSESDQKSWDSLVIHVNNTMNALADDGGSEVEVVFWGPGLDMLKKTNTAYEERLKALNDHGVKLLACRNAMKMHHLATEDLFPFAGQVPSGIAEIVKKQEAGWAYVH